MNREDLIILAAASLHAVRWSVEQSVQKALQIEAEVIKQRKAQDNAIMPASYDLSKGPAFN
jgi:hypothetical protein